MDVEWAEISDLRRDECVRVRVCVRAYAYVCVYTYYLASAFIPMVTRHKKDGRATNTANLLPDGRQRLL